jgi:hypothetical protein
LRLIKITHIGYQRNVKQRNIDLLALILSLLVNNNANAAELGEGHSMPTSNLGDRMADLKFQTVPTELSSNHNSEFDFSLVDNKTGNNMVHVTCLLEIMKDDKTLH